MKLFECLSFSHFKSANVVKAVCQLVWVPLYFLGLLSCHWWIFFYLGNIICYKVKSRLMVSVDWIYSEKDIERFFHFCKKFIPLFFFYYLQTFVIIFKLLIVLPFIYLLLCLRKICVWCFLISLLSFLLFDFSKLIFPFSICHFGFTFRNNITIFFFIDQILPTNKNISTDFR